MSAKPRFFTLCYCLITWVIDDWMMDDETWAHMGIEDEERRMIEDGSI